MGDDGDGRKVKEPCPACGATIKPGMNFCPQCSLDRVEYARLRLENPDAADRLVRQRAMRSIKSIAGLNAWRRSAGQIAVCAEVEDLKSGLFGLKKGLAVRPGTRAILVRDGKLVDTLGPGAYTIADLTGEKGILGRLTGLLKGASHCEIYLVDDGEFRVSMGDQGEDRTQLMGDQGEDRTHFDEQHRRKIAQELAPDFAGILLGEIGDDPSEEKITEEAKQYLEARLKQAIPQSPNLADKIAEKITGVLVRHGWDQKLDFFEDMLNRIEEELSKDKDREDSKQLREYFRERRARVLRLTDRIISDAVASSGLLRVRTKEGFDVELKVDLFFRVEGNMEFVGNVLRGRIVLRERDLVEKIHGTFENVLQSAVQDISADELYGNMAIRDRIREEAITKLAPTLKAWGLKLCRVEGFNWNLGRYEEYLKDRADLELEQQTALLDKARQVLESETSAAKHAFELERMQREAEKEAVKREHQKRTTVEQAQVDLADAAGKEQVNDLRHRAAQQREKNKRLQEIELGRTERLAQLEAMTFLQNFQMARRTKVQELLEARREAEHRRTLERTAAEHGARLQAIEIQASMTPQQILALAAAHNPALLPALQAYFVNEANEAQVSLVREFEAKLQEVHGQQHDRVQGIMQHALSSVEQVAGAAMQGLRPQVLANPAPGQIFVNGVRTERGVESRGQQEYAGHVICGYCGQEIAGPLPEDKLCVECRSKGRARPRP